MKNMNGSITSKILCITGVMALSLGLANAPARSDEPADKPAQQQTPPKQGPLPESLVLDKMPANALEISQAIASLKAGSLKPGDHIALRGRIPLAQDAFDPNLQVFALADDLAEAGCVAQHGAKDAPLPASCSLANEHKASVRVMENPATLRQGALENKGGLTPGAEVFVLGYVAASESGLLVNASKIHIPRASMPLGLFVSTPPADAKDLSEVRKNARNGGDAGGLKKGDKISVRGLVGGSKDPFVAGRAVMTIVGFALKPCNAKPDDHCDIPWDYCCDTKADITANSATIRVVDAKGNPLKTDFKGRLGIKELSDVAVVGTVASAEKGGLVIDAQIIHVGKP